MRVESRFPATGEIELDNLLAEVSSEPPDGRLTVGDPRVVGFLSALSSRLLSPVVLRSHPEVAPLGFFLRRTKIQRILQQMLAVPEHTVAFPRGVVFQIPPANVATIFVYSWALSALAGNVNVVRVSARATGAAGLVLDALNDTLAEAHPAVGQTQRMISYDRHDEITARLSASCDLRVIWGEDRTVDEIRRHPLLSAARDLTFPNRSSFAAISVAGWKRADPTTRRAAVEAFANDAYWFDQAACASPGVVFLVGERGDVEETRREFLALLVDVVRTRPWTADAAMAVEKRVATYGLAAEGVARAIWFANNEVVSLELRDPRAAPRRWLGTGTFPFATVESLIELVPAIARKDQTLSHMGFTRDELIDFAAALGGRGIDRMVPFGSALDFSAVWDGFDLPREFIRITAVVT